MYKVSVRSTGSGTVLPGDQVLSEPGADVTIGLHPVPGHKVGSIKVDGVRVDPTCLLSFPGIGADHEVEVNFLKTCVGRTLEYTLSNTSSGITLSGTLEKHGAVETDATLSISLFNPSNHISLSFPTWDLCRAKVSTDDLASCDRNTHVATSESVPGNGASFRMTVRGGAVAISVLSQSGEALLDTSCDLFSGDGAILEHGWVVAVDGSATDGHQYPLDLRGFVVEADERSPMLLHGKQNPYSADPQSRRYVGTF